MESGTKCRNQYASRPCVCFHKVAGGAKQRMHARSRIRASARGHAHSHTRASRPVLLTYRQARKVLGQLVHHLSVRIRLISLKGIVADIEVCDALKLREGQIFSRLVQLVPREVELLEVSVGAY